MDDKTFSELKLKASIVPSQLNWPEPRYTHWIRLHEAVTTARARVGKAFAAMDAADHDNKLSTEGKRHARAKIAESATAELEKSEALEQARAAVSYQMQKWADKVAEHIKPAEDSHTAMLHSKILDRVATMNGEGRLSFLQKNAGDLLVASALLSAPAFVSGLNEVELNLVRSQLERRVLSPEIIEARAAVEKALADAEKGWQRAAALINHRAGVVQPAKAAAAA